MNNLKFYHEPSEKLLNLARKYGLTDPRHDMDWKTFLELRKDYSSDKIFIDEVIIPELKRLSALDRMEVLAIDAPSKAELMQIEAEGRQDEILEMEKKTKEEYEKILTDIKSTPTPNISKITWKLREFIRLVLSEKTDKHTIVILGKTGTGKTTTIKSVLKEFFSPEQLTKIIRNGHSSPLSYYNTLYDNPNGIFFWDDLSGLYKSEAGISLLKQTAETYKKRLVCYSSTTSKLEHRSTSFFFEGFQILCMNGYPNSKDFEPILSRIRPIEFNPTYKEILILMYEIIKDKYLDIALKNKIKIVEFLERNSSPATKNFDLRLLNDVIDVYRYCEGMNEKFTKMMGVILEIDEAKEKVLELNKSGMITKDQIKEFKESTHKSRATYFNLKSEMGLSKNRKI